MFTRAATVLLIAAALVALQTVSTGILTSRVETTADAATKKRPCKTGYKRNRAGRCVKRARPCNKGYKRNRAGRCVKPAQPSGLIPRPPGLIPPFHGMGYASLDRDVFFNMEFPISQSGEAIPPTMSSLTVVVPTVNIACMPEGAALVSSDKTLQLRFRDLLVHPVMGEFSGTGDPWYPSDGDLVVHGSS